MRNHDIQLSLILKVSEGHRAFTRGERYFDLPPDVSSQVPGLLGRYVRALAERAPKRAADWRVEDAAWRVAGTGSLGVLRVAILVPRDESSRDRLFDLKESRPSAVHRAFPPPDPEPAMRAAAIVQAARALLKDPPRLLAAVDNAPGFIGRRLFPQEDKLALEDGVNSPEDLAREVGWTLGRAHRRAATKAPAEPWSDAELSAILDEAIEVAGLFESVYLAYCRLGA